MVRACAALVALVLSLLPLAGAQAADPQPKYWNDVQIVATMAIKVEATNQDMVADTMYRYAWLPEDKTESLIVDYQQVKVAVNKNVLLDSLLTRDKLVELKAGAKVSTPIAELPPAVQARLKAAYGTPLCKRTLDENGLEIKREVVAGPDAKLMIDNGVITNALLFHPPFYADKSKWESPLEFSMGNGGFAKGKLTYVLEPNSDPKQPVFKVYGSAALASHRQPGPVVMFAKDAAYEITGEQTYDTATKQWISGKMKVEISFRLDTEEKEIGSAAGNMDITFKRVPAEKQ
ncbi:MAG TPA: hypothetical protein VL096_03615 [Pirellulaceae bacterium]|nr:hypothetical protein [Pirellulaceae bacterium]